MTSRMPTILLARHGQASFGGVDYDLLSQDGLAQSTALARELTSRDLSVDRIVSGSLRRQRDTAGPAAAALRCGVAIDPRWNEYDMDDILASHSTTSARASSPSGGAGETVSSGAFQDLLDGALRAWIAAGSGSPAAETWPRFTTRVSDALTDLAGGLSSGSTGLVITSGGVLAALCVSLFGLADSSFITFNRVAVNTGITKVVRGRRGTTLVSFNEHGHLERDDRSLVTYR